MQQYPMTVAGAKQLEEELHRLKTIERPKVINAIAEARGQGDLSENAEYEAAKEKQGFIEMKIAEIENKLSHSHIIDTSKIDSGGKIIFGMSVKLLDLDNDNEIVYQIVGEDEADIKIAKISINSPVARSLIGKEVGDVVEVRTPNGIKEYEVLNLFT